MNIIIENVDYWRNPERRPFPSKKELARRINVSDKAIQNNIRELEKAGLVRRELRTTAARGWNSNTYRIDGLAKRIQKLEPNFTEAKEQRPLTAVRPNPQEITPAACLGQRRYRGFRNQI